MLDRDLAQLYGVETKVLNQAVRRNLERFPEDFMFELTKYEANLLEISLRSQFVTLNKGRGSNYKYAPLVFTEQGVAMLMICLKICRKNWMTYILPCRNWRQNRKIQTQEKTGRR